MGFLDEPAAINLLKKIRCTKKPETSPSSKWTDSRCSSTKWWRESKSINFTFPSANSKTMKMLKTSKFRIFKALSQKLSQKWSLRKQWETAWCKPVKFTNRYILIFKCINKWNELVFNLNENSVINFEKEIIIINFVNI